MTGIPKKLRVPDLAVMKRRGERIVMLTAYDATMARFLDRAGIDLLLVGDSLGNVILGLDTTIPVTLDAIIHHTAAVTRGAHRALVVADMPFLPGRWRGRHKVGRWTCHFRHCSKTNDRRPPCDRTCRVDASARASPRRDATTGTR